MNSVFLISDAAKQVKVEAHVLRYWEVELDLPIKRNELGHRFYTEEDVKRFQEIKDLKERGLQLKAIRMVLKNGQLEKEGVEEITTLKESEWQSIETQEDTLQGENTLQCENAEMRADVLTKENNAEKMQRLQWLLQQLFKETLQQNNECLCQEMKEGILKELDYQFRMQEEREEERNVDKIKRDEEHFKRLDELLRKKRRLPKK